MSKRQKQQERQEEKVTEKARWMLEGSHGMTRDADAAVALLEEKVKDGDIEAMWMLGVCCEFGMGTEKDVERADQLYKRAAEQGNTQSQLLAQRQSSWFGSTDLFWGCEQFQQAQSKPRITCGGGQTNNAVQRQQRHWLRCS